MALLEKFETLHSQLKESLTEMEQIENPEVQISKISTTNVYLFSAIMLNNLWFFSLHIYRKFDERAFIMLGC